MILAIFSGGLVAVVLSIVYINLRLDDVYAEGFANGYYKGYDVRDKELIVYDLDEEDDGK